MFIDRLRRFTINPTKLAAFVLPVLVLPVVIGFGTIVYFDRGLGDGPRAAAPSYIFE